MLVWTCVVSKKEQLKSEVVIGGVEKLLRVIVPAATFSGIRDQSVETM
jgi:hypothetical protein